MQAATQIPVDIVTVIQSLIVLFVAAPPLIRAMFRLRRTRTAGLSETVAKGWNA
jgi:simple sugar transport system permease protein